MRPASYLRSVCAATLLAAFALLVASRAEAPLAAEFTDPQKSEIGTVVRDYLLRNPEVLQEALTELDRRQKAAEATRRERAVDAKAGELFHSADDIVLGNPQGRVTLVEFFDYNCGYCKRALDDVARLLKTEPELRLVLKDFPVLGPGSVEAAQIAVAARNQLQGDRFWQFHSKLLSTHGPVGKSQALSVAKDVGADLDQIAREAGNGGSKAAIASNLELADSIGLTGTPSFVIGREVVVGAVGYDELKDRIDSVLKCGKAVCS